LLSTDRAKFDSLSAFQEVGVLPGEIDPSDLREARQ
jgi:hypothetical protein